MTQQDSNNPEYREDSSEIQDAIDQSLERKKGILPYLSFVKKSWVVPLIIGIVCTFIMMGLSRTKLFRLLEYRTYDWRVAFRTNRLFSGIQAPTHHRNPMIAVVPVDNKTLREIKDPMFFWTPYFAEVFNALVDNGAAVIALDYQFQISSDEYIKGQLDSILEKMIKDKKIKVSEEDVEPYLPNNDMKLGQALLKRKVILMTFLKEGGQVTKPYYKYALMARAVGPDKNLALVNGKTDEDGVCRRQFLYRTGIDENGGQEDYLVLMLLTAKRFYQDNIQIEWPVSPYSWLPFVARELLSDPLQYNPLTGDFSLDGGKIPVDRHQEMLINFIGPADTYTKDYSFVDLVKKAEEGDSEYFRKNFEGKAVLIGPGYTGSTDLVVTPFNAFSPLETYGIEVHANILNTMLNQDYIFRLRPLTNVMILFITALLVAFVCQKASPLKAGMISIIIAAILTVGAFFLLYRFNLWMNLVTPIAVIPLAFASVYSYRYVAEDREKRFIRKVLGRYISEDVAREILKDPSKLALGGKRCEITILFCDINDFTTMSEKTPPEEVIAILNDYFTRMEKIIFDNKGTLKQFVGDEIMVISGTPQEDEDHAYRVSLIAIEMVEELKRWQQERSDMGKPVFDVKFGIHSGQVVAGNVGSPNRTEYTTVGDVVNTASRIMGLTKQVGSRILISEETLKMAGDRLIVEEKGEYPVKGKEQRVRVYELQGIRK